MTCNDCTEIVTPDGRRVLLCALHASGVEWRAHAEALAGALRNILRMEGPGDTGCPPEEECHLCQEAIEALARLPADALAERQALEACAALLRESEEVSAHVPQTYQEQLKTWGAWRKQKLAALAALDAARKGT